MRKNEEWKEDRKIMKGREREREKENELKCERYKRNEMKKERKNEGKERKMKEEKKVLRIDNEALVTATLDEGPPFSPTSRQDLVHFC